MDTKYDLISIGDTTIDVFMEVTPEEASSSCSIDKENCLVCFDYGAKVPVSKLTRLAGVGNAANNAVGSSRLGLKTAIYTVLGSDPDSQECKKVFEDEDVSTEFVVMENGKRANFSTVLSYSGERTIFVYHEERTYNLPDLPNASWAYFTSIGKNHDILHTQVSDYIKKSGAKLGYNPGSHELKEGLEKLKPILEVTEVIIVNREEAQMLVGGDKEDTKDLILRLHNQGPKTVVITDGESGSYASLDGREVWFAPTPDSPIIERTGCGDAYATAFVAALSLGKNISEAMIWGTMNATSVIQYIGAREGLLTRTGIDKYIGMYGGQVKPKLI